MIKTVELSLTEVELDALKAGMEVAFMGSAVTGEWPGVDTLVKKVSQLRPPRGTMDTGSQVCIVTRGNMTLVVTLQPYCDEYGEYCVLIMRNGTVIKPLNYYTNNYRDAIDTFKHQIIWLMDDEAFRHTYERTDV